MTDNIYNLSQDDANSFVERCVSSKKYYIYEQSNNKVVLKENSYGNFFIHIIIFAITFWSYGIFNIIYAVGSGKMITINIKENQQTFKKNSDDEVFAEVQLNEYNNQSNFNTWSPYISHNNISDKNVTWLEKDEKLEIAGLTINSGMLFISKKTSDLQSVISTNLSVSHENVQVQTSLMGYWPSYSSATPEARKAYLKWLADGRKYQNADIGYVFLFFYGLEWRFFKHIKNNNSLSHETLLIIDEVKRLLSIYAKQSFSFNSYATKFLEYIQFSSGNYSFDINNYIFLKDRTFGETPLLLRIELGKQAYNVIPVSPELALAWAKSSTCHFRTPATRCEQIFDKVFITKYTEILKGGIKLSKKSKKLVIDYRTASSQLRESTSLVLDNVLDISRQEAPIRNLQKIINASTDMIDEHSRFLGRNPDKNIEAKLYLPSDVRGIVFAAEIDKFKNKNAEHTISMPLLELLAEFGLSNQLNAKSIPLFMEMLNDACILVILARPLSKKVNFNEKIFVKVSDQCINIDESNMTSQKQTICAMSYILFNMLNPEEDKINIFINSLDNSEMNRIYLKTMFISYLEQGITLLEIKNNLQKIAKPDRLPFLQKLTHNIANIIDIKADTIRKLEEIGTILSVDTKELHALIHSSHEKIETKVDGKLDFKKINKLKTASKETSVLLHEIFSDDEPLIIATQNILSKKATCILNFDGPKEEFFNILISQEVWDKDELSKIAKEKKLMLEGILEEINDQSYKVFDDALIELSDNIYVNLELLEV